MRRILKALFNWKQIYHGIMNTIFKKRYIEQIAAERMKICEACPLIDRQGSSCLMPGTQPCCSACGCKLKWKVRSLSSDCGNDADKRWKAVMSEEKEIKLKNKLNINIED